MASVGAYLKKLLYQYDCVVVPELGGFLTHYQPATFAADTKQFLPPRKRLAFNEALRLDDGILTNYIMLHESLSREDALHQISDFVSELRQHVQLAGSFSVEGIGLFTHNVEGRLQFDPGLRHNFFGESFGMTAIQAEKVTAVPVESVDAEEVTPVYALGPVLREEVLEETPYIQVRQARPLWLRWAAAVALVGSLGAVSYLTVLEPGQPMESSLNPANWFRVPSWLTANLHRDAVSNVRKAAIRPAAPAPVAKAPVAVAPVVVSAPPAETPAPPVEKAPVTVVPVEVAKPVIVSKAVVARKARAATPKVKVVAVKTENPFVSEPSAEGTVEPALKPAEKRAAGPLFTVVAGSFASKQNAVRFRKTLMKAGYSDAYLILPGRKGQLYKVAAVGSSVREEAIASTDSLKKLTGITPFIIRN